MTSSIEGIPARALGSARTLVTGGAGFIGSQLVDALLSCGAQVRVLDNLSTGDESNLAHCADGIEWLRGDIRDLPTCRRACAEVDFVFHQAALGSVPRSLENPAATVAVNTTGSANVFTAARDAAVKRVVYASSSSVYGDSDRLPKREGEEGQPVSPYALSKQMCEDLALQFASSFGMEIVGLRYFNVYGPRQSPDGPYAAVIPRFFTAFLGNTSPTIFGDGDQSRDFTSVDDAVRANLLAVLAPPTAAGAAYNVAAGQATTITELARIIGRLTECEVCPTHEAPRPGDVLHSLADLTRVKTDLGYQPLTSLEDGLADCLEHYRGLFT